MNNKFKQIDGWMEDRFKEFAVLQRGKDLTDNDVISGSYPVVKSNGVDIYHNQFLVEPDGVVTGRSGTIGKVFYIKERFWAHNTTLYVKDFRGNHPKFIFYLIQSMNFEQHYAGTTIPTLNRNDIHRLRVNIPKSVDEQINIATVLSKVDDAITVIESSISAAEKLKKSLMHNLLTGKLRPDSSWRTEEDFFVDEKFGRVPVGWEVKKWGEVIRLEYGKSLGGQFVEDGGVPVYGTNGQIGWTNKAIWNAEGIIVGRKGAYREVEYSAIPFWVIDTAFYVAPKIDFNWHWAYYALKQLDLSKFDSGSAIPSTNKKDVYFNKMMMPADIEEQKSIATMLNQFGAVVIEKQAKITTLQRLKKSLMQNLLTGKIRLSPNKIKQLLALPA